MSYQPLDAGSLDKRVTIQSRTDSSDAGGDKNVQAFADVATVWASVAPGSGREFIEAQAEYPELSHVVKIRYRSDVTAKHRLTFGSRVLLIHAKLNPMERNEQLVLYCSEKALT